MPEKLRRVMMAGAVMLSILPLLGLSGCAGEKYRVDYGGAKCCYSGAKDSYRAGQTVTLYFDLIATDTDYSFLLDGEPVWYTYDEQKGFVLEFTMPEHDVKLECRTTNTMFALEEQP